MNDNRPLAVLGATGYTGRLVVQEARVLGLPLRLVGRRLDALEALAHEGDEVRVADAAREAELLAAFEGAFAVASTAGPFLRVGTRPVGAAIAVGAHYLDTSGEQEFARVVYDGFGDSADERGVVLLTSFGFDYVPGDFAARLAAEALEGGVDEIAVAYSTASQRTSRGTRATLGHVLGQRQVAWERGFVPSRFGATTRRFVFPSGEHWAVEWGGTEPLTVPRHTDVARVRSYLRAPRAAALGGRAGALLSPLAKLAGRVGPDPGVEERKRNRFTVVAEARRGGECRRATLTGYDTYGLAAALVAHGAAALRAGEARGTGALAPAEAFDVRGFAPRLLPRLVVGDVVRC